MIKYFVRTTLKRNLNASYNQIDYELLIDYHHNCGKAFLEQLECVNDFDSVLLEDDVILCKDFKNRIEKVIAEHPNDIINFFSGPLEYQPEGYSSHRFCWNQCTYFPKGIGKKIVDILRNNNFKTNSAEANMRFALIELDMNYYIYRPYLVQHIDDGSLMGHNTKHKRRSPFFIDYLDELGITYDEAFKYKRELMSLMESKFKDIDDNE